MSDHITDQTVEAIETAAAPQYTVEYILLQMAEIQIQTICLNEVLTQLSAMSDGDSGDGGSPGNIQGQAKAQALGDIVRCRETTNQQVLTMYEKMLDRLLAEEKMTKMIGQMAATAEWVKQLKAEGCEPDIYDAAVQAAARMLAYDIH